MKLTLCLWFIFGLVVLSSSKKRHKLVKKENKLKHSRVPYIEGGDYESHDAVVCLVMLFEHYNACFCGGTIIHEYWAVTAASCISSILQEAGLVDGYLVLRGGADNIHSGGYDHHIDDWIVHDGYYGDDNQTVKDPSYNIALLNVVEPFKTHPSEGIIQHVASYKYQYKKRSNAVVYGWGAVENGGTSSAMLKQAIVALMDNEQCQKKYSTSAANITNTKVCAERWNGSTCDFRDVGSPLFQEDVLIGVATEILGCGDKFPPIFIKISNFTSWIAEYVPIKDVTDSRNSKKRCSKRRLKNSVI